MRFLAVCVILVFGAGWIVGAKNAPPPKVDFIEVPHTVYKEGKTETKVVHKGFTDACKSALEYADKLATASQGFDSTATVQLDIMEQARIAMVSGDLNATSQVITDQNKLNGETVGYAKTISETLTSYEAAKKECDASE